jgi:hypothetical protein
MKYKYRSHTGVIHDRHAQHYDNSIRLIPNDIQLCYKMTVNFNVENFILIFFFSFLFFTN